jgi:hypothetical protein
MTKTSKNGTNIEKWQKHRKTIKISKMKENIEKRRKKAGDK